MSDPVVPPTPDKAADVVDAAKEGLAEAKKAASKANDAASKAADAASEAADSAASAAKHAKKAVATPDAETKVIPAEPVAPSAPQPIFVQAPEPPRPKGNRATSAVIGLLAALTFAILYLLASFGISSIGRQMDAGPAQTSSVLDQLLGVLGTWGFWVPVVVFFLGFWLLGAIINRGRWAAWVIFGVVVGLLTYGGHILGVLVEAQAWNGTFAAGWERTLGELLSPLAIAAFFFGREVTIWFGAWVARIGKRKTELNIEAQREYERTLEAGPVLSR